MTIDLLFTDIDLGDGQNGSALIEEISERRAGLRVIVASGYAEPRTVPTAHDTLGVVFLQKPYSQADLCAALNRLT